MIGRRAYRRKAHRLGWSIDVDGWPNRPERRGDRQLGNTDMHFVEDGRFYARTRSWGAARDRQVLA